MLRALTPAERHDLIMSVGVHVKKRRANPLEIAKLITKAQSTDTLDQIAAHVNLQGTTILRKLLALNKLPRDVQTLVDWGSSDAGISFSVAAEIARLTNETDRRDLAQMAVESHLSKSEVQAIVQRANREKSGVRESAQEILGLRPSVEQRFLYLGLLDDTVSEETAKRNIRRKLSKLIGATNVLAVRCDQGRFSILLSKSGAESGRIQPFLKPHKLQAFINDIAAA